MPNPSAATPTQRAASGSPDTATIGASTFIKGKIEGTDDLVVRGRVEGTIRLPKNSVLISAGSQVKANVTARSIQVEGTVNGKLKGGADVIVRAGGTVEGEIVAPRVTLDNGARFNGTVDMEDPTSATQRATGSR